MSPASIEAIGTSATIELAYSLLRQRGRPSVIGYSDEPVTLSAVRLMYYELEFVGSVEMVSTVQIVDLGREGKLKLGPIVSGTIPLAEINEAFERLRRGEGVRWVVTP